MIKDYLEKNKEEFKKWLVDNEQGRIDIKILPYLQDIQNGFFVEAGALDGLFMSNTKLLEDLGWNGLLVEPSKKAADNCRKNRKSIVERTALVSKDHTGDTVMGDFVLDGEYGIGAWSSITRHAYGQLAGRTFNSFMTEVPVTTFEKLFDKYGITTVDFLSLDVEGFELEVLKGINFEKVKITYILVEVNLRDYPLEAMDELLSNYDRVACLSNFSKEQNNGWDGSHQDYLYRCK
jgi:FkbM family methyltransferase